MPASIQPGPGPFIGATALAADGHGGVWITAPAFYPNAGHLLHFAKGTWRQVGLGANVNARSVAAVPASGALCAVGEAANFTQGFGTAVVWSTGRSC